MNTVPAPVNPAHLTVGRLRAMLDLLPDDCAVFVNAWDAYDEQYENEPVIAWRVEYGVNEPTRITLSPEDF